VTEVGVELGGVAVAVSVVRRAFAVPTRFVMEPTEKSMGVGANIKTERPNTTTGKNTFGVSYAVISVFSVPYAEVGVNSPNFFHIVKASS
jgi:hypothetical protein